MDYPLLDPGYSPELLAQADRISRLFATKPRAPVAPPPPEPLPPNGVLTDIGHGFVSGLTEGMPTLLAQAAQYPMLPDSGSYKFLQERIDASKQRQATDPALRTTGAWGAGAEMLAAGLPALAAGPVAAAAGLPTAGAALVGGAAGAALFGAGSAQERYERELKLGATPEEASSTAAKEGLIQGVGQGVASAVGARALTGTAGVIARGLGMGGETTAQGVFNSFVNASVARRTAIGVAENVGVQVPVQAGAAAASAALGKEPTDSWEAAKASVAPTLAMGALMSPLIGGGTLLNAHRRAEIVNTAVAPRPPEMAQDATTSMLYDKTRSDAIRHIYTEMRRVDPIGAEKWRENAEVVIARGEMLPLDVGFDPEASRRPQDTTFGMPETPSAAMDVHEMPTETIDIGTPDKYQPQTIDVHDVQQPPPVGDVREQSMEHIDIGTPESYDRSATTINIDAPLWGQGANGAKSGRGSGITAEEVGARLQAAKNEEAPGQGTARALGLLKDKPTIATVDASGGAKFDYVKQDRVKWLNAVLGRTDTKNSLTVKLADLEPTQLSDALRQVWHEKGGEAGPQYLQRVELLYKQLTGKDVRESASVQEGTRRAPKATVELLGKRVADEAASENAVKADAGTESKPAASQARTEDAARVDEVAQAPGNADAGRGNSEAAQGKGELDLAATMALQGAQKVTASTIRVGGKEFDAPVHGAALNKAIDAGVLRKNPSGGYLVKENGAWRKFSADKGDDYGLFRLNDGSVVSREDATKLTGEKKSEDMPFGKAYKATATKTEARAADKAAKTEQSRQFAEKKATQIQDALQRHRAETATLQAQVRDIFANPSPSTQDQARKTMLEAEIEARNKREEQVVQMHTEALADAEDAKHGNPELVRAPSDWGFLNHPWNTLAGIGKMEIDREGRAQAVLNSFGSGRNLLNLADYVTARILTNTATKAERSILHESNAYKGASAENRRSAQTALDALGKADSAKYAERAEHFARSMKLATAMSDKISEVSREHRAKVASETIVEMAHLKEGLAIVDRNVAEGKTTPQEGQELKRLIAEQVKDMIDKGVYERGINSLNHKPLADYLRDKTDAKNAMEYIARNHSNPVVRAVAKLLGGSEHLTAQIVVVDNPTFDGGRYIPLTNTIEIGRGGLNAVTLMHEATHALVHRSLDGALYDQHRADLTGKQRANVDALHEISSIMEKFRDMVDLDVPSQRLALESEHEFVAEALNNEQIQAMLGGRSGLWTRFMNTLRGMVGLDKKNQTDFDRLMGASTTLFGDPRQDTMQVFNRSLTGFFKRDLDPTNPTDAVEIQRRAVEKMAGVSAKIKQQLGDKDISATIRQNLLKVATLNHQMWVANRIGEKLRKQFPEASDMHEATAGVNDAIKDWRQAIMDRAGLSGHLVNGKDESQDMMRAVLRAADKTPQPFLDMTQMARNAKYVGIDPSIKTFTEAKKTLPKLTEAEFNHKTAVDAREAYQKLARSNPELIKLYGDILQKHRLDFARWYGTALENTLRAFGLSKSEGIADRVKELDLMTHRDLTQPMQESKLNGAMRYMQGKVDDLHQSARLVGEDSQAFKDATLVKSAVDDLLTTYNKQRATPYVHIGRSGDYHVGFEVADTPGAWDRVGAIVEGKRAAGGLERDWHAGFGGKRNVYMKFASAAEMNEATNRLQALRREGMFKVPDTKNGVVKDSYFDGVAIGHERGVDSISPEFVRVLSDRYNNDTTLNADERALVISTLVDTYRQQLPETSPLKANMFAENTAGASQDFLRTFGDRMTMSNQSLVNARAAPRMAQALSDLRQGISKLNATEAGDAKLQLAQYVKEWMGRAQDLQIPVKSPVIDAARGVTASWDLAMSPAYTVMTSWQPWQMSLPAIGSKYGMVRSAMTMASKTGEALGILQALLKAGWGQEKGDTLFNRAASLADIQLRFKELKKPDGTPMLSGETLGMLEALQWSSMMNFGQAQQIFRTDPASKTTLSKAIRVATIMPHYAEMLNRIVTATSAYEMARKVGKMSIEDAQQYALQTVTNTDGNHSQANIARALGRRGIAGKVTPLFVGFGQYDIQMTEQLARVVMDAWGMPIEKGAGGKLGLSEAGRAQKQLLGIAVMTSLMAGTLGLPMVGMLTAIANGLGSMFGDPDETPPDFQRAWRQHMDGIFGEQGGEIVAKGLPRALDFDMSSRSGYQDLLPFTSFLTDRRKMDDRLKDAATTAFGPTVGIGMGVLKGVEAYNRGDYVSAINDALPAFLRNEAKAYRLSKYGYETQGGNNEIPITPSSWNVFMQSGGFVGGARAEQSERTFQFNTNNSLLQRRQQELRNRYYRAIEHGDFDEVGKILQDNVNFAVQHPQYHADMAAGLLERARQRAIGGMTGGMLLNPRQLPYAQQMFPDLQPYGR